MRQTGTIKTWNGSWGFIKPDTKGIDVFVHYRHIKRQIKQGDKVSFEAIFTPKGVQARKVKLLQIDETNWHDFIGDVPHKDRAKTDL